jgi:hypothetical protein
MLTLVIYTAPLFALHIAYAYLRPRDILSLFPMFAVLAAYGAVWLVRRLIAVTDGGRTTADEGVQLSAVVRPPSFRQGATAVLLIALTFAFVLRSMDTLLLPVTRGFGAFGYLVREQRESFTRLGELTPPNAVIGCTLNSGAVDLHAGRLTFRPATWAPDALLAFVRALREEETPVFVLEDGAELADTMTALRQHYRLSEITRLDMPYYFRGSGSENRKVPLYRIDE